MLKLLKYELKKTSLAKIILLILGVLLEGWFLLCMKQGKEVGETVLITILAILGLVGALFIGIQSVVSLHRDMNTKQSYMLFMTPHSNYAILGAKVVECMLSVILITAAFFTVVFFDFKALMASGGELADLKEFFLPVLEGMLGSLDFSAAHLIPAVLNYMMSWINTIILMFLADVIVSSFFNGKRGGMLISLLLIIALSVGVSKLMGLIPDFTSAIGMLYIRSAAYLVLSAVMYVITVKMMEKYLSV